MDAAAARAEERHLCGDDKSPKSKAGSPRAQVYNVVRARGVCIAASNLRIHAYQWRISLFRLVHSCVRMLRFWNAFSRG